MKKLLLPIVLLAAISQGVVGQVTEGETKLRTQASDTMQGWKTGGVLAVNVAQTSLTNWASGGQNSFSVNGLFSVFANYKRDKTVWDNSLDVGYGVLRQGDGEDYMKTDDKFDFLSKYGRKAYKNLYYAALLNFKTQMTEGKDYATDTSKISNILAPAYVVGAIGMDYKPNSYVSAFVAPVTGKVTIVNDQDLADLGAFGVDPATYDEQGNLLTEGETFKGEFGGYVRIIFSKNDFKQEVLKNVSFTTKVDLFSNYVHNPQNVDVSWETLIAFKVNKYISVNVSTHLLYDDDISTTEDEDNDGVLEESGPKVQFKEILGVGFSYNF